MLRCILFDQFLTVSVQKGDVRGRGPRRRHLGYTAGMGLVGIGRNGRMFVLGMMALACSGRYTKGGVDDGGDRLPSGGNKGGTSDEPARPIVSAVGGSTAGIVEPGVSSGGSSGAHLGMGASSSAAGEASTGGASTDFEDGFDVIACLQGADPRPTARTMAEPNVVWSRLSCFIWGEPMQAPLALPPYTTPEWIEQAVTQAFVDARTRVGAAPGGAWFVRRWLRLSEGEYLQGEYGTWLVSNDASLISTLLTQPLQEPQRIGVFSEPRWLSANPSIPTRGMALSTALIRAVPAHPEDMPRDLDPALPERDALVQSVAVQPCKGCHVLVDQLGMAFLHFDKLGEYRETELGQAIDSSGSWGLASGERIMFANIESLETQLARSCDATRGLVDEFLRVGQEETGVSLDFDSYDVAQATMRQGLLRYGRSYEGWVKAFALTQALTATQ